MAQKVRTAAETYARKFYIMYDVTGWTNMQSEIKTDWTAKMSAHTASSAYARQNGKPVVCIWGFGFNDANHPWDAATCLDVVTWFKSQGCYVIGGVPREWRTGTGGSRAGYLGVYHAFNMLSPWMVGAIGNVGDSDSIYQNINVPDQADCNANGVDYQPCVLPGDLSARQRVHGDFMWRQFYNMVRVGAQGIYISMFDEFNEGNQITKTAATQAAVPTNSGLLSLDEDGTACTSDYYLRLTNDGGRMLKGQVALTATRPTQPGGGGGGDTVPPSVPAGLSATGHSSTSASLSWSASTDNVGVAAYTVYQVVGSTRTTVGSSTTTAFTVNNLTPATAYTFVVTASDTAGNVSGASNAVSVTTDPASSTTNLALHRPTSESSHNQTYASGNAVDGDTGSYWESANNAFPQWMQVDLGTATALGRVVLKLPPSWGARSQTVAISGSTDGSAFSTLVAAAAYTFDPTSANAVTLAVPSGSARFVRATISANTGWPAGQLAEFEIYSNGSGGGNQPPSAPGALTATAHTSSSVSLSWTAATDDVGVTGYQVRQAGTVIATVGGSTLTYTVTGLTPATAYAFTVTAGDANGAVSPPSNAVTVTTDPAANANLARGKATSESSHVQTYASGNAVDGDANSYWESANNAFPQWLQVDLGSAMSVARVVLKLPPSSSWATRTQTLSIQGSTDGATFGSLAGSAGRTFDPATGNQVAISFSAATVRYVRINVTANSGWPAGQVGELEVYSA